MTERRTVRAHLAFMTMATLLALFTLPARNYPLNADAEGSPEKLAMGTAATPYQYRILVPWIARHTTDPGDPAKLQRRYRQIEFVALLALGFWFRALIGRFIATPVADVLALSIFVFLPFNYRLQDFYPYDTPAIVFMAAGLTLIYMGRWTWFYPLFVLATFNRETTFFLIAVAAAVWFDRQPLRQTIAHLAAQCVLWIAVKVYLFQVFGGQSNTGDGLFETQLKMNAALVLGDPMMVFTALSTWGYLWIAVVLRFNRIRAIELRRTLMLVPIFVATLLPVGVITETRIYGEMLPIVLAGALVVLVDFFKSHVNEL